jgi:hypothetical protein
MKGSAVASWCTAGFELFWAAGLICAGSMRTPEQSSAARTAKSCGSSCGDRGLLAYLCRKPNAY